MNKLDIIKFLLNEIEEEEKLFKIYENDYDQAQEQAVKNNSDYCYKYLKYKDRVPSNQRIKDNCKKIRQLLLEISKEI